MEEKAANSLLEQQRRRKRINRMKMSILTGLLLWILAATALGVFLLARLFLLEDKLDKLSKSVISVEQVVEEQEMNQAHAAETEARVTGAAPETLAADGGSGQDADASAQDAGDGGPDAGGAQEEARQVYLTFDDGPSGNTEKILDILKEKNVKATFFVIGKEDEKSKELYRRIVAEGHTLGMHSFTHKYNVIYESLEAFSEDVQHLQAYLEEVTGEKPMIMRFPGGSSNQVSNLDMRIFIHYLNEEGITYYDWNVASGDATSQAYTADELIDNVMNDVKKYQTSIVLMHDADAKVATVEALGPMIDELKAMGAQLLPIEEDTKPIQHISADSVD